MEQTRASGMGRVTYPGNAESTFPEVGEPVVVRGPAWIGGEQYDVGDGWDYTIPMEVREGEYALAVLLYLGDALNFARWRVRRLPGQMTAEEAVAWDREHPPVP